MNHLVCRLPGTVWLHSNYAGIVAMSNNVRDNTDRNRFELDVDGHIAFSNYRRAGRILSILHTEVPKELEGRGIGSALIRGVLDAARNQGLQVNPVCPFAKNYIERHPEYAGLRA